MQDSSNSDPKTAAAEVLQKFELLFKNYTDDNSEDHIHKKSKVENISVSRKLISAKFNDLLIEAKRICNSNI